MKRYQRMTYQKRLEIEVLYNKLGYSQHKIAKVLGFARSSISVEIRRGLYQHRNYDWTEAVKYSADRAQRLAKFNQAAKGAQPKIGNDHEFVRIIEQLILKEKYSPAAALAEIERRGIKTRTKVCVRTLYNYIDQGYFPHITNKDLWYRGARKKHKKTVRERKPPVRGTSIDLRPPHVFDREEFGHWELDSVIGTKDKGNTLLVLTERKTRFELIFRAKDKTAAGTVSMLNKLERHVGSPAFRKIFQSITCDNGSEFANFPGMETSIRGKLPRTRVYFCHPYCSSERGSNENQNRLIRRFIKKGTPIGSYSDEDIAKACDYLNDLPRQLFGWQTARERFAAELAALGIRDGVI